MKSNEPIDIVILWVDSQDSKWKSSLKKNSPQQNNISNDESRFRCWNTLHFIFRSFDEFLPWVNKVHFVTYGHLPTWLNVNHPKLNVVRHEDIIPEEHRPTFNSNAIEVNLNKIESLSEQFILFNDDTFILSPLSSERFFIDGKPVDFLNQCIKRKGWLYSTLRPQNLLNTIAINNNIRIVNQLVNIFDIDEKLYLSKQYSLKLRVKNRLCKAIYREYSWFKLNHVPQPHLKSTIDFLWRSRYSELYDTSSHKFRSKSDTTQYLFRYFNLATGKFFPHNPNDTLSININSSRDVNCLIDNIKGVNLLSITDADSLTGVEFERAKLIWGDYLLKILPAKSSFEL
ncbi:hypothetical protein AB4391_09880 [Vibrio lentus]|uniref:Stealth protein CR2 conserved region 2 domain-containing protein n=1 Tax=Vibrio lentus TaxID=136468 RepID=A0A2N7KEY8_9VIBR|nr:hypothetical protein [Vibrio lentus]PMM74224.1 hypothetical protein BCT49_24355 [Vibrio lentus]